MSFPKKGKKFPTRGNSGPGSSAFSRAVSLALTAELRRDGVTIKTIARWTGAHERTVKIWVAGRCGPTGDHLVALIRYSDEVAAALFRLADRPHASLLFKLHRVRAAMSDAVSSIDDLIAVT